MLFFPHYIIVLFSPLRKLAERAIHFACIIFFSFLMIAWRKVISESNRKSVFKRLNSNNRATSCKNLGSISSIISEFTLLKRAIFAAIRPQFDDDLHSLPRRSETDWQIAIFISHE